MWSYCYRVERLTRLGTGGTLSRPSSGNATRTRTDRRRGETTESFGRRPSTWFHTVRRPTQPVRSPPAHTAASEDRQTSHTRGGFLPRRSFAAGRQHHAAASWKITLWNVQELVEVANYQQCRSVYCKPTSKVITITTITLLLLLLILIVHRVSKKLCQLIFCSLSVKYKPISIKIVKIVLE